MSKRWCLALALGLSLLGQARAQDWAWSSPPGASFLVVSGAHLADFEGSTRTVALQGLTRQLYAAYRDEADFLLVLGNRREIPALTPIKGYHLRVSNSVQGIGVPTFNAGKSFGGTVRLQGILYFPNYFPFWKVPFNHEFAHQWANDLLPTSEPGHFGFCGAGSQLGGFDSRRLRKLSGPTAQMDTFQAFNLRGLPFGTASNGNNSVPYSDFELYLMGLLPANAVKPFQCAYAGKWVDAARGIFQASRMHRLTMPVLQRRYGPRQPDFIHSPKTFRLLVVLLSEAVPTPRELSGVSLALQHLTSTGDDGDSNYTFNEATRGLGRLDLLDPRGLRK